MTLPVLGIVLLAALPVVATDKYVRTSVDNDGQLRILTADGRTIVPKKAPEQVGFAEPQISPDGGTVGWLAEYPNCCTSYPIPLKLVIHTNGKTRAFTGSGLPIWRWAFQAGGRHFAFRQETVHGGLGVNYELHDVITGRLLAEFSPAVGPDNQVLSTQNAPKWVTDLDGGK
jgi:hypothetical protein